MADRYDWPRIHKAEDNIENQIVDWVFEHVQEHFGVEDVADLTDAQIAEIDEFRNELHDYSVMQVGYSALISYHESQTYEDIA